jgi:hypothetical protein
MGHKRPAPSDRLPEGVHETNLAPWEQPYAVQVPSITCPVCGMTSYNPTDVAEGYCGNCHDWTSR